MGVYRVKCEICGEEFFATGDGARRCYKCNSEFLNKGMIEDGAKSFEGESDINCPYCGSVLERGFTASDEEAQSYLNGGYMECPKCGKEFWLETQIIYEYSTYQLNKEGEPIQ